MPRVTVAFEFASPEEAVVFLGKQIPEAAAAVVVAPSAAPAVPTVPKSTSSAGEKRGRGRPKEPNSRRSKAAEIEGAVGGGPSPAAPTAPAPEPVAPEPAVAEVATPQPVPSAAVPSKQDLVDAMQNIMDTKGIDSVLTTLAKFGVEGAGQLPEAKRAEFIVYCAKVAKGEIEAGK